MNKELIVTLLVVILVGVFSFNAFALKRIHTISADFDQKIARVGLGDYIINNVDNSQIDIDKTDQIVFGTHSSTAL